MTRDLVLAYLAGVSTPALIGVLAVAFRRDRSNPGGSWWL